VPCLDAHVDVFGDQDDRSLGELLTQMHDDADDLVVGFGGRQRNRQDAVDGFGLEKQVAGGQFARRAAQVYAFGHVVLCPGDDLVEQTAGLACVAGNFRHAFLVGVEFLQRHHRHVDVVLLEAKQAQGVMHQHIGIQHKELGGRTLCLRGALGVHKCLRARVGEG